MSKDDFDDVSCALDFEFADPDGGRKAFYAEIQDIVDQGGSEDAKKRELVLEIGSRVQAALEVSQKSLANVFSRVMGRIAQEEGLTEIDEGTLTDIFIKYSVYGPQLDAELKQKREPRQQTGSMTRPVGANFAFAKNFTYEIFLNHKLAMAEEFGPEAASKLDLLLILGERVQERLQETDKKTSTVFNFVMSEMTKEYGLKKEDQRKLTGAFIIYSEHGHQLDVERRLRTEQRANSRRGASEAANAVMGDTSDPDHSYDERPNTDPVPYSFSREAGLG